MPAEKEKSLLTSAPTKYPDHLPRLPKEYYQSDAVVHWTMTTFDRGKGWLNDALHARFRELMLHAAAREGLLCPTYCPMPDHVHLIWMGLRRDTDQRAAMAFLRTYLEPALTPEKFQPQAQDNVLRQEERKQGAFAKVCFYVLDNPRRAGLVSEPRDWQFCGTVVPGYPKLHPLDTDFWEVFWRLYLKIRHVDAGEIKRPAF